MKRKRWSSDEKTGIVMEWMTTYIGTAELCRKHGILPTTLQAWRDSFLEGGRMALNTRGSLPDSYREKDRQIESLTMKVGELTMALDVVKKTWGKEKMICTV